MPAQGRHSPEGRASEGAAPVWGEHPDAAPALARSGRPANSILRPRWSTSCQLGISALALPLRQPRPRRGEKPPAARAWRMLMGLAKVLEPGECKLIKVYP